MKPFLDRVGAFFGLLILSPVLITIAILVRVKLGSPVLFVQIRPGKDEKPFKLYKFRTMTNQADSEGMLLDKSRRMTNFGRKLRVTSLDELPELFNILVGDMPLLPNNPYSASKAGADLIVRAYYETFGLPVNITRSSNNYGPFQFPEKLIPLMINNCLNDRYLPVYGDGMQIRDWIHVDDHCSAIDAVLHGGEDGDVYNIGSNNEKANIEIVRLIIETLEKTESLIQYVKDRPGHDRRYAIDNTKIRTHLGWEPAFTFELGMLETIKWYLSNSAWIENVISGEYEKYYEIMYE